MTEPATDSFEFAPGFPPPVCEACGARKTLVIQIELFGRVLSESIVEPLERYSWWPFDSEPPSASLNPPR